MSPCISKHVERQGHTTKKTMVYGLKIRYQEKHNALVVYDSMEAFIYSLQKKKEKKKRDSIGVFINLFIFTLIQKLVQNNVEKKCVTNSDAIKSVKMMLGT